MEISPRPVHFDRVNASSVSITLRREREEEHVPGRRPQGHRGGVDGQHADALAMDLPSRPRLGSDDLAVGLRQPHGERRAHHGRGHRTGRRRMILEGDHNGQPDDRAVDDACDVARSKVSIMPQTAPPRWSRPTRPGLFLCHPLTGDGSPPGGMGPFV